MKIFNIKNTTKEFKSYFKEITSTYDKAKYIYIGKIPIAGYRYDPFRFKKDGTNYYKVFGKIPTIKENIGYYATEEECEKVLIKIAKKFIEDLTENKNE